MLKSLMTWASDNKHAYSSPFVGNQSWHWKNCWLSMTFLQQNWWMMLGWWHNISRSPRQHDAVAAPRRFQPVVVAPPRDAPRPAERPPLPPPQAAVEVARTPNVPPLAQGPSTLVPGNLGYTVVPGLGAKELLYGCIMLYYVVFMMIFPIKN